jgi:hypothetical protein
MERDETTLVALPTDASLIDEATWAAICREAGGEEACIATLGVTDMREDNDVGT